MIFYVKIDWFFIWFLFVKGITKFEVSQNGGNLKKLREFYWNEQKQQYFVVELENALQIGKAELHIEWAGPLVRLGPKIQSNSLVSWKKTSFQSILSKRPKFLSLESTLVGINKVTYTDRGKETYIIATKFEPTYAREAYPCFDEVRYNSIFYQNILYQII